MNCRKLYCISFTTLSIALGGSTLLHAADGTMPDSDKMQQKVKEQEKDLTDLKANFTDAGFVNTVSMANNAEVKAGEAAIKTSKNDDVLMLAHHMVDDHTKAGSELKALAEKKGWLVSETCDAKHKMAMEQMGQMNGADFDRSYAIAQVKDHEDTVALFKLASEKASDADLKNWVNQTLPTLESHLKMAQDLEKKMMANPMVK